MELQGPATAEQVESLILLLYQPNTPEAIANTQAALAHVQSLPQAWKLSKELISRPDEKVQFFGVLTIIVKLNTENESISNQEATELLTCLIGWYADSVSKNGSRLVTRKLVSALSTYFLRYHDIWPQFLVHIGACLATNQTCLPQDMEPSPDINAILALLGTRKLQALLWVATNIVEDVTRLDPNSANNANIYNSILENSTSLITLMARCLQNDDTPPAILEDAVKCLQSWILLSQKAPAHENNSMCSLQPLVGRVIEFLVVDAAYEVSAELLTDSLLANSSLFTPDHYRMFDLLFKSQWASTFYERIAEGDFAFDATLFAQLLLAFADTRMAFLVQTCHSESSEILSHVCDLLLAKGYPAVDDRVFVPVVEFWSSFAEAVPDYLPTELSEEIPWKSTAFSFLLKASSSAWQKITYPASEEVASWDSNDRAGFTDSRKDVVDLLLSVYALVGPQLLRTFADTIISSLRESSWLRLEAAAYCLGGLADCCQDDDRCDDFLASVFDSELFSMLRNGRDIVPTRTQQTCLQLIEMYTEYFERHPVMLPLALELLFSTLGDRSMAATASKSILRLCSSCRGHLRTEIDAFLAEYARVTALQQLDCVTSERTLGALSSVAQAITDPLTRHEKLGRILEFIESDLHKCRHLPALQHGNLTAMNQMACPDSIPEEDASLHMALKVLRCLVGVGKGVQTPSENAIDLEHENQPVQLESTILPEIQRRIVSIIVELQERFPVSAEITEQICNVLRTGFSEMEPGPFVLPSAEVAQYFASHTLSTPRVGLFISTACSFINSIRDKDNQNSIFLVVLEWVIGLLKQLPSNTNSHLAEVRTPQIDISAEPEVAQNAMEIASRMLSKEPTVILKAQPPDMAEYFFLFTLQALDGNEPLPKAAAAEFWATFVNIRSSEEGFQAVLSAAMATLGPLLCQSIARNIGGNASRSELDKLSEPLKKLFNRYPKAKDWLEAGLNHPSFPSSKVSQADKSIFVKKLSSLRGARATNQIVRDFWLAARGSTFSYAA